MTSQHHHHSLILLSVTNSSLGRYYCLASNTQGGATKSVLVSGLAGEVKVISERQGELPSEYRLQWEVPAQSDILQWKVQVRKEGSHSPWDTHLLDTDTIDTNTGHLLLTGLEEATLYHVRVSARNDFGWRHPDRDFVFGTRGSGKTA